MAPAIQLMMLIIVQCSRVLAVSPVCPGRKQLAAHRLQAPAPIASPGSCTAAFHLVFAFGDSITDTGNAIRSTTASAYPEATTLPYGETFFKEPTGRFCDGRIMVDDLCTLLQVPFLPPYLAAAGAGSGSDQNYAVAGATALDVVMLQQLAGVTSMTEDSLGVQIDWFKTDTAGVDLSSALVYLGEIGGNDYNYVLGAKKAPEDAVALVPAVIKQITTSLDDILKSGVMKVVVQGQFPMGCISVHLHTLSDMVHDKHGCIMAVTALSDKHNQLLKEVIANATRNHPDADILYFDTSAAYLHILDSATSAYNFTNVQDPCYNIGLFGSPSSQACPNPENYMSWDGIHLTEAMYAALMNLFLTDSQFTSPFPNFITSAVSAAKKCSS